MEGNGTDHCEGREGGVRGGYPATSALMFSAGVLGNAAALVLLEVRRRGRRARSARGAAPPAFPGQLFPVLLTALLVTDLLGTCSVSPLVMAAYARNESLRALGGSDVACQHFGFAMTFLSLVTLALLLCMALERCLSVSAPYFYARRLNARCGYVALALVYASGALFCLAPFLGFGAYVQYCPGTWCFVDMRDHHVYKNLYASCMLVMIACTVLCNACVIYQLVQMYRRCKVHRGSARRLRDRARTRTLSEELEHLVLLVFMTITFLICSLPLVICVYISSFHGSTLDLTALLMLSVNPILHPWVFLLLSPPVPRLIWGAVCKMLRPRPLDNKLPMSPRLPKQTSSELQT